MKFLSTPSARRATALEELQVNALIISIHALREEGDHAPGLHCPGSRYFYPRPPRGGRQLEYEGFTASQAISIHALREEGDGITIDITNCTDISIHALREEGDPSFSIEISRGFYFYPRPPRGGRQISLAHNLYLLKFLSTPSARRATLFFCTHKLLNGFLSTPSARRATGCRRWHSPAS